MGNRCHDKRETSLSHGCWRGAAFVSQKHDTNHRRIHSFPRPFIIAEFVVKREKIVVLGSGQISSVPLHLFLRGKNVIVRRMSGDNARVSSPT